MAFCAKCSVAFPPATLAAIAQAIKASETVPWGEVRFVIEGSPLFGGQSSRERAIDLFSQLRMWDTEYNSGVLIYRLLADRAVEIVADRGMHAKAGVGAWVAICHEIEAAFKEAIFEEGAVSGIDAVMRQLKKQYQERVDNSNDLPDQPVVL